MLKQTLKRVIVFVLMMAISMGGVATFAGGLTSQGKASGRAESGKYISTKTASNRLNAQEIFKDVSDSEEVKEGTEAIVKPWVKVASIAIAVFGMLIIIGTIWFLGSEAWGMIRSKKMFDRKVFWTFVLGLVIGVLFVGSGIFDAIGVTDNLVAKTLLKIFDASQ